MRDTTVKFFVYQFFGLEKVAVVEPTLSGKYPLQDLAPTKPQQAQRQRSEITRAFEDFDKLDPTNPNPEPSMVYYLNG